MIYLDNAATTFKKPKSVIKACTTTLKHCSANSGRGGHAPSMAAAEKIFLCRNRLCRLFNAPDPSRMILTCNATCALNIAIRGILKEGDHAVLSGVEHNSSLRPAVASGASLSFARPVGAGLITPEAVEKKIKKNTKLVCVAHASNVTGEVNPIIEIAEVCKKHGIPLLVDGAQTVGTVPVDILGLGEVMFAFAGHKGLYGPVGTGGLYISEGIELLPFITGGTGTFSKDARQPEFLPDRFESGTQNVVGFAGLAAGADFVLKRGCKNIFKKENELCALLREGIKNIEGIKIFSSDKGGILSFVMDSADSVEVANLLDSKYKIAVRGGLHCAPLTHQYLGTINTGLVRISAGAFNTEREIVKTIDAIRNIKRLL